MMDIFNFINQFTGNYGWTIVIFTILFRLVLSPLDVRSRIGQREYTAKMAMIQPEIDLMTKAYKDSPEKISAKTMEIRKKAGVGLLPKGCGTMLLTYPILIAFFAVFRNMAGIQMTNLANNSDNLQYITNWFSHNNFLWIKNIWMPDAAFSLGNIPVLRAVPLLSGILKSTISDIIPQGAYIKSFLSAVNKTDVIDPIVSLLTPAFDSLKALYPGSNGFFILPILAGASQYLSFKIMPTTQPQAGAQAAQAAKTTKYMQIFFPILFIYFCLTSSSALAIYWITSNLCMLI